VENLVANYGIPMFWANKKVLVTGHTGFKGSWLSLWLQQLGADVVGFSLPPPTPLNLLR
jgi:CDP-glucose 4,6-dehydratase